jgi:hypothetical protein
MTLEGSAAGEGLAAQPWSSQPAASPAHPATPQRTAHCLTTCIIRPTSGEEASSAARLDRDFPNKIRDFVAREEPVNIVTGLGAIPAIVNENPRQQLEPSNDTFIH